MSQFDNPYEPTLASYTQSDASLSKGRLATRGERFAGAFIDGIIILVLVLPLSFGVGALVGSIMGDGAVTQIVAQVLGGLVSIGAFLALQGYFLATRNQTLGKMALGTKIVSDSGQPLTFQEIYVKRYLLLQLLSLVPFVGGFIGLVDSLMIFRSNCKCLHDDIAGTKVIKLE